MSPKLHSISHYDQPFSSYRAFSDKCAQWSQNDIEPHKVKCILYFTGVLESQISVLFTLPFSRYKPFWDKCTEWSQNHFEHYKVIGTLYMCHFTPFCSTTKRFRGTGHFKTSAANDPKMTSNHTGSPVPHICVTGVDQSQILLSFAQRPVIFLDIGYFEKKKCTKRSNKWSWSLQGQRYLIYVLLVSPSLKFHPIFHWDQAFSRYKVVNKRKCTKWPQNDLEHLVKRIYPVYIKYQPQRYNFFPFHSTDSCFQDTCLSKVGKIWSWTLKNQNCPICTKYLTPRPNFSSVLLYNPPFFQPEISEMYRMTSDWFWNLNSQTYLIWLSIYPRGLNLGPFCSTTSRFRDTRLFKNRKNTDAPHDLKMTLNT